MNILYIVSEIEIKLKEGVVIVLGMFVNEVSTYNKLFHRLFGILILHQTVGIHGMMVCLSHGL